LLLIPDSCSVKSKISSNERSKELNAKKFIGMFTTAIISIGLMIWGGNFSYAEEETHTHSEKGLTPEHKTIEPPICPACKNVRVRPIKGKTLATMPMVCLDCKNEISEVAVHHCDKCGKDVLACVMCQKTSAELKAAIKEAECPKCKEVRVRPIKGKTLAKWEMKCPDCKHKSQEFLIQHCNTCDADFIACPICKREEGKAKK
jgi:hypothetical protein